jgi:hypothetical protein
MLSRGGVKEQLFYIAGGDTSPHEAFGERLQS